MAAVAPHEYYYNVLFKSLCDEIDRCANHTSPSNRRTFLRIMQGLLDDNRAMPSRRQALSVSSPVVRFVFSDMLTRWDHPSASLFRRRVLHHISQLFPSEDW